MFTHKNTVNHPFDNNYCSIHNQPEVNCTQTHEVTRNAKQVHERNGEKHCQRNNRSNNKSCPHIAKQQYQDEDDDQSPFEQVARNRTNGASDKIGTVQKRFYCDPFG